ncbi:copper chaperone PCu(A)C [Methylococcus geothermalis]|uniref:Copper chaperone PCu(A)C n=1 Tax=Methylococcus geothermalis TaxID=2681310 RepID=A0A858QA62_9GAMM|nr:copper chaperone PCu(A)C [Methylococcus geothermalis]QJD30635.1 copper chaperone PCu(A)C [Methylococcus geothermalis]
MKSVRALCCASAFLAAPIYACEGLEIADARVMESPPGASVLAGFATLRNGGDTPITIRRADSPDFSSVEFHSLVRRDGLIRMAVESSLTVPPHGMLAIKSGERHLMLFKPAKDFHAGDRVTIRLFCSTGTREVKMTVEKNG